MKFDSIAQKALDIMEASQSHLFLTGKAGTGKSTLLRHFLQNTEKEVVVLAPTGVAALNIGGQTIHSFCGFSTTVTLDEARQKGKKKFGDDMIEAIDTIVIDEISMVRADMLDCIHVFLQEARGSYRAFGGIQMILVGDPFQLPPVVGYRERQYFQSVYHAPYFFSSRIFNDGGFCFEFVELEHVYRQRDDSFLELLNKIRNKEHSHDDILALNKSIGQKPERIPLGTMYLTATNNDAAFVNSEELELLESEESVFDAYVRGDFPPNTFPSVRKLLLKVGAQVMFVSNQPTGLWANGTLGYITEIDEDEEQVKVQIFDGDEVTVGRHTWQISNYIFNRETQSLDTEEVGSFVQLPLKLARATTIHKSQGKTYDTVLINPSGIFEKGQLYVALSRCSSLDGITLTDRIKNTHVKVDPRIILFMKQTRHRSRDDIMKHEDIVQKLDNYAGTETILKIEYLTSRGESWSRPISVYSVGWMTYKGRDFQGVKAYCHESKMERVFNSERILEVSVLDQ